MKCFKLEKTKELLRAIILQIDDNHGTAVVLDIYEIHIHNKDAEKILRNNITKDYGGTLPMAVMVGEHVHGAAKVGLFHCVFPRMGRSWETAMRNITDADEPTNSFPPVEPKLPVREELLRSALEDVLRCFESGGHGLHDIQLELAQRGLSKERAQEIIALAKVEA